MVLKEEKRSALGYRWHRGPPRPGGRPHPAERQTVAAWCEQRATRRKTSGMCQVFSVPSVDPVLYDDKLDNFQKDLRACRKSPITFHGQLTLQQWRPCPDGLKFMP